MSNSVGFTVPGWNDYVFWQTEDKRTLKKINSLITDIVRGMGMKGSEALKR
jgi:toxin YoeB